MRNNLQNLQTFFKSVFIRHWVGIVFSLIVGLLAIAPQAYFIIKNSGIYHGIYILESDAERNYLGRQTSSLQYGSAVNPFIKGAQTEPSVPYSKIEGWLAYPSEIFGISILELNLAYKFLFPCIVFFLFYLLLNKLGVDRQLSILGAVLILLGSELFSVSGIKNMVFWRNVYDQFIVYARPINPQVSSIFFVSYLLLFISNLNKPKKLKVLGLSVILGLSFYVYFYTWTFLLVFNLMWFLYFLWQRKIEYHVLIANIFGLILGALALQQMYGALHHPGYQELASLTVTQSTHKPVFGLVSILATIVLFFILKKFKLNGVAKHFLIVSLLSVWVVNNQQVITGLNIQAGHYHWYYNIPVFVAVFIVAMQNIFLQVKNGLFLKRAVSIILIVGSVLSAVLIQTSSYNHWESLYKDYQKLARIIDTIKQNHRQDSVVLANEHASEIINLYGGFYVFWSYHSQYYLYKDTRRVYTQDWVKEHKGGLGYSELPSINIVIRHKILDDWIEIDRRWRKITELDNWQAFEIVR